MSAGRLIVEVKPRLHVTLIGMNTGGYRINGGLGFAVEKPSLQICVSRSAEFALQDRRALPFAKGEILRINETIAKQKAAIKAKWNIAVEINGDMPTHFGFGSSSAVRLACVEALYLINEATPNREELVLASGRGGTSGIGINSYFEGGLIVDLGRKSEEDYFRPSQLAESRRNVPLMMQRLEMPDWEVGICIPKHIRNKSEREEVDFFARTCPLDSSEVHEILYHVVYGLYAAVRERDKETFCDALKAIQGCAWKRAEREQYGKELSDIEERLYEAGAEAVGMSSLGPSLFFFAQDLKGVIEGGKSADCTIIATKVANSGRRIVYV